jgi:ribosomal protein S18 acetylase RimI-like enzyme
MTPDERLALEEAAARAWPHRREHVIDGWRVRLSGGGSKRANSVQTLRWSGQDAGAAIRDVEALYRADGQPAIFQVVDISVPGDLDARLERRGYRVVDRTILMTKRVERHAQTQIDAGRFAHAPAAWFDVYLSTVTPDRRATAPAIIAGLPDPKCFFVADVDGAPAAVGLGVAEGSYAGVECMATLTTARRSGGARRVMRDLEHWAAELGAETLWLQVVEANTPARRLYESLGFEAQGMYWYRVAG